MDEKIIEILIDMLGFNIYMLKQYISDYTYFLNHILKSKVVFTDYDQDRFADKLKDYSETVSLLEGTKNKLEALL